MNGPISPEEMEVARAHLANKRQAAAIAKAGLEKMQTGMAAMAPPANPTGLSALAQAVTQLFRMADGAREQVEPKAPRKRAVSVKDALSSTQLHTHVQDEQAGNEDTAE